MAINTVVPSTGQCACSKIPDPGSPWALNFLIGFCGLSLCMWMVLVPIVVRKYWNLMFVKWARLFPSRLTPEEQMFENLVAQAFYQRKNEREQSAVCFSGSCPPLYHIWILIISLYFVYFNPQDFTWSPVSSFWPTLALLSFVFFLMIRALASNFVTRFPWLSVLNSSWLGLAPFVLLWVSSTMVAAEQNYFFVTFIIQCVALSLCPFIVCTKQIAVVNIVTLAWRCGAVLLAPALQARVLDYLILAVVGTLTQLFSSVVSMSDLTAECRLQVQEKMSSTGQALVQSLLTVMCDAVVLISKDFETLEPSPKLGSILLHGRGVPVKQNFINFLSVGDRERFKEFMNNASSDGARSLHVDLVDACGSMVSVQIFQASVVDARGDLVHMLGLVESGRERPPEGAGSVAIEVAGSPGGPLPPIREDQRPPKMPVRFDLSSFHASSEATLSSQEGSCSESGSISSRSNRSGRSGKHPRKGLEWQESGTAALVIQSTLMWNIIEESEPSRVFFHFSQEPTLLDFVSRFSKPRAVLRWLEFVHFLASNGNTKHPHLSFGAVWVRSAARLRYKVHMKAEIYQAAAPAALESSSEGGSSHNSVCSGSQVKVGIVLAQPKKGKKSRGVAVLEM